IPGGRGDIEKRSESLSILLAGTILGLIQHLNHRWLPSLFTKPAGALRIIPQGAQEVDPATRGPVGISKPNLRIGRLPQQKSRKPLLTRGADNQVWVRQSFGVQVLGN